MAAVVAVTAWGLAPLPADVVDAAVVGTLAGPGFPAATAAVVATAVGADDAAAALLVVLAADGVGALDEPESEADVAAANAAASRELVAAAGAACG